ncbi:hypothetical protein [Collimonas humicola]|uniref:hypothetical protein n=1 Tax=Collimonas humicola TaxID=2825886 RepID=UPI001B8DAA1D|nr:hypothetical protein [Collimonas humicola]
MENNEIVQLLQLLRANGDWSPQTITCIHDAVRHLKRGAETISADAAHSAREGFVDFLIRELGPSALADGKISIIDAAEKAWHAAFAAKLPPTVPDGWQLMPKVLTPEMLEAARRAPIPFVFKGDISANRDLYFAEKYAAMRAVTPTPPIGQLRQEL